MFDMGSVIGVFLLSLIFLVLTYLMFFGLEGTLYDHNKLNMDRKTIRIGIKWLFLRHKKNDAKEIFIVVFISQLIGISIFMILLILLIASIIMKSEIINMIGFLLVLIYLGYFLIVEKCIKKRHYIKK